MPKAYPAYFGDAYEHFDELRAYLDGIKNLYLVGRNGMHRYNNQDHSMLSAMFAVEAILAGSSDKSTIWGVNIDDDYHEETGQDMTTATANEVVPDRELPEPLAAYAVLVLLLVLVSGRLWSQLPLALIDHEFDYSAGPVLVAGLSRSARSWVALGRRRTASVSCWSARSTSWPCDGWWRCRPAWARVNSLSGRPRSLFFALGMPWVSPDVFFYIGTGWLQGHYGVSPYVTARWPCRRRGRTRCSTHLPGLPRWGHLVRAGRPETGCLIAGLSGGNEKLALALYKVVGLALHAGCSALVWRLAPENFKRVALFSYAANPLICFSVLTCAHNDHRMNLLVLLALLSVSRRSWLLAGVALGVAFGIKYFPLVFLPVFGLAALVQQRDGGGVPATWPRRHGWSGAPWHRRAVLCGVSGGAEGLHPRRGLGIAVYRNWIYYFLDGFTVDLFPPLFGPMLAVSHQGILGATLKGIYGVFYAAMLLALTID